MDTAKIFEERLLRSRGSGPSVDPDRLRLMGKQASARYLSNGVPLNTSVIKLASEVPGITAEHIKRVCEFANQDVFAATHEKLAGEAHRCVEFAVADPSAVLAQLSGSSEQAPSDLDYHTILHERAEGDLSDVFGKEAADHAALEEMEKQAMTGRMLGLATDTPKGASPAEVAAASLVERARAELAQAQDPDQVERVLEELKPKQKTAIREHNPHRELFETLDRVSGMHDQFLSQSRSLGALQDQAVVDTAQQIKTAMLEHGTDDVVAVMYHALGKSKKKVAALLGSLIPHLEDDLEFSVTDPTEKLASALLRDPDMEHPLFQTTRGLHEISSMKADTDAMLRKLASAKKELEAFVRESGVLL